MLAKLNPAKISTTIILSSAANSTCNYYTCIVIHVLFVYNDHVICD